MEADPNCATDIVPVKMDSRNVPGTFTFEQALERRGLTVEVFYPLASTARDKYAKSCLKYW